jgi:thermopsin
MFRTVALGLMPIAVLVLLVLSAGATATGAVHTAEIGLGAPAHPALRPASPSASDPRETQVLSELRGSGIPTWAIHLPDFSVPRPYAGETVGPTYSSAPAPMGVADLGLTNVSGTLVGSVLNTSSVEGTITLTNALSAYVDGDSPNMYGIQLNAVDTGVTLFGNTSNYFWTQNFVSYTPSNGTLTFGDNVWNFSNFDAYISPNVFYAHGPNGTLYAPVYYYAIGPTFTIHYPFTITFYDNSSVLDDRPAVYFNYTVSNRTTSVSGSYDYVVFNATTNQAVHLRKAIPAGVYQINGQQVNPVGLPSDLELDVVGNDDGDTTTFYQMQASLSIATWSSASRSFVPVRSAEDAGAETGETSDGVDVSFAPGTDVAQMRIGPSFLYGLWGESTDSGARTVVQNLNPAATFVLVNPGSSRNESAAQWVVGSTSGSTTFYLPNGGTYWIEYLLSDHAPGGVELDARANSTTTLSFTGRADASLGIYTPLIAFGNAELGSLSASGSGTASSPYVLDHYEPGALDAEFAAWNDFQWPVFPGILLVGTTDYVTIVAPSLEVVYPAWMNATVSAFDYPATNNLQIQLWQTSHVVLDGGTVSGWLSSNLAGFPLGSVMVWASTDDLIAGTTFADQGDAVLLYGGTANTVWGNTFTLAAVETNNSSHLLNYGAYTQAVNESESGDLIYNNYVGVPFPAITPTLDPVSCQIECVPAIYVDSWNVSRQPASDVRVVDGVRLSGDILGYGWQGGNYWSNYGSQSDPYGVLPYNNSGAITVGGDYEPLSPTLYRVSFTELGLRSGTLWSVTLSGISLNSTTASIVFYDPNGSYPFSVAPITGHPAFPSSGTVRVRGENAAQGIIFA